MILYIRSVPAWIRYGRNSSVVVVVVVAPSYEPESGPDSQRTVPPQDVDVDVDVEEDDTDPHGSVGVATH
jgi:hypothetical protein